MIRSMYSIFYNLYMFVAIWSPKKRSESKKIPTKHAGNVFSDDHPAQPHQDVLVTQLLVFLSPLYTMISAFLYDIWQPVGTVQNVRIL